MTTPTETELSRRLRALPPDNRGVRWAWIVLGSLFAVPLLLFGTFQVVSQLAHDEETVQLTFTEPGIQTLDIRVDAGEIRVIGTDEDTISVTARISNGLRATTHDERVEGDTLVLRSSCPGVFANFCSTDYTVRVPRHLTLIARGDNSRISVGDLTGGATITTDNGGVEALRIDGPLDLRSDNGTITADEIRSTDVQASSDNGSIRLTLVNPPERVQARSDNGSITIIVPDTDHTYATDLTTDNGNVNNHVRTDPASPRTITASSDNGSITVRYATD